MEEMPLYESPRLTKDEIQQQLKRLTTRYEPQPIRDPFPVCPTIKFPKEKVERITQRVYYEQIQRREAVLHEAAEKQMRESGLRPAPVVADEEDLVRRVYYNAMERNKMTRQAAEERLLFRSTKEVPKVPLSKFVEDMYVRGMQREKEKEIKLYEKYILPTEIKTTKIPSEVAEESARRLTARSGAN